MNILFCCFSGTGNTLAVCGKLSDALRGLGHGTEIRPIAAGAEAPRPSEYDSLVIGYPVHAFNAPAPVLRFLKSLPKTSEKKPVFLVRTSGEPLRLNECSGISPKRILRRRGYEPAGEFAYVMPYNIIFRHSDGMAARMMRGVDLRVPEDAAAIAAGTGKLCSAGPLRRAASFALRIEHTAMPLLGRRFRAGDACVGCGVCAAACPEKNIRIEEGKPRFGKNCVGCMSCAFRCPADAIRISLLNGWRVNGAYSFAAPPATDEEVCDYCHKSYVRYFHAAEDAAPPPPAAR